MADGKLQLHAHEHRVSFHFTAASFTVAHQRCQAPQHFEVEKRFDNAQYLNAACVWCGAFTSDCCRATRRQPLRDERRGVRRGAGRAAWWLRVTFGAVKRGGGGVLSARHCRHWQRKWNRKQTHCALNVTVLGCSLEMLHIYTVFGFHFLVMSTFFRYRKRLDNNHRHSSMSAPLRRKRGREVVHLSSAAYSPATRLHWLRRAVRPSNIAVASIHQGRQPANTATLVHCSPPPRITLALSQRSHGIIAIPRTAAIYRPAGTSWPPHRHQSRHINADESERRHRRAARQLGKLRRPRGRRNHAASLRQTPQSRYVD
jgi:hypothetical protein